MSKLQEPESDTIEVIVLGRGLGESILLHMGDDNWIVIDSFKTSDRTVAPLAFLERLGVSADAVKLILATHWHDDHAKGLAALYEYATVADFAFSSALEEDEFAAFVGRSLEKDDRPFSAGVKELIAIEAIRERDGRRPFIPAAASHVLYLRHADQTSFNKRVELVALSPSPWDIANFYRDLEERPTEHATRLPLPERNHASVACWAHFEDFSGILGADLEHTNGEGGWNAILSSRTLPHGKADFFKIPHHGSETGHSDEVWNNLVAINAFAVLAPWMRGGKVLPKKTDVDRIKAFAGALYTAKDQISMSYKPSPAALGKLINSGGARITALPKEFGYVRSRRKIGSAAWTITVGGGAVQL